MWNFDSADTILLVLVKHETCTGGKTNRFKFWLNGEWLWVVPIIQPTRSHHLYWDSKVSVVSGWTTGGFPGIKAKVVNYHQGNPEVDRRIHAARFPGLNNAVTTTTTTPRRVETKASVSQGLTLDSHRRRWRLNCTHSERLDYQTKPSVQTTLYIW